MHFAAALAANTLFCLYLAMFILDTYQFLVLWKYKNLEILYFCSTLSLLVLFPRWLLSVLSISFWSPFYACFGARVGIKSMPSLFLLSIFSSRVISCTHLRPPPLSLISMGSSVIEMYNAWPLVYVYINIYIHRGQTLTEDVGLAIHGNIFCHSLQWFGARWVLSECKTPTALSCYCQLLRNLYWQHSLKLNRSSHTPHTFSSTSLIIVIIIYTTF